MSSAHDRIMVFVTGPGPNSLEKYTSEDVGRAEETVVATAPESMKSSKSTRVKKIKDRILPKRNLRSTGSTEAGAATNPGTGTTEVAGVWKESSPSASATSNDEGVVTRSASKTEKRPRVDRKSKRFVTSSKDPRAVVHKQSPRGKKRAAEDKKGGRAKRQVRSSQELGLTYNSIKAINMPPRLGLIPGQDPPAPVVNTYPFGDTEDHQNSMIIYWLDDLEYTYAKTTELYNTAFPNDRVTDEAVRRRHIRSLERLQKRYGAKSVAQIGVVGRNISRRGRPRAPRLSGIEPENEVVASTEEQPEADVLANEEGLAATSHSPSKGSLAKAIGQVQREKRNHKDYEFDKACIVIWRDADRMSFKDIRAKLDNEHGWSLGEPTVKKEYTRARARIWGTTSPETAADEAEDSDGKANEDGEGEDTETEGEPTKQ